MSQITDLTDKVVVITGAASGIGRGLARAFAEQGAKIVASDIDVEGAEATAALVTEAGHEAIGVACDVADSAAIKQLADTSWERFGHVDIVCANAGIAPPWRGSVLDVQEADARKVIDINLMGAWATCAEFGTRFIEQGTPSHIVVTASENTVGTPAPGMAFYTAAKHGLLGLTDLMRDELPDHVGLSIVLPGIVATNLTPVLSVEGDADPEFGLSAIKMARHTVTAMLDGEYFIVAHPPVVELVDERAQELRDAFARQAPRHDDDAHLDTRHAMEVLLARFSGDNLGDDAGE